MDWRKLVFYPEPEARDKIYSHAPVHVTDFPVNVHVDELSSAGI
jgi:hypothetical protein